MPRTVNLNTVVGGDNIVTLTQLMDLALRVQNYAADIATTCASLVLACEQLGNKTNTISSSSTTAEYPSAKAVYDALETVANSLAQAINAKADASAIPVVDSAPTIGSSNAVSSGGVYAELAKKVDSDDIPTVSSFDATPTEGSAKGVQSGGVYTALAGKESTSNRVNTITSSSTNAQYPTAKAVWDLFSSLRDVNEVKY